jgi:hypothetical protein
VRWTLSPRLQLCLPLVHVQAASRHLESMGGHHIPADPPALAAEAIDVTLTIGTAHGLVADPARAIVPGSEDAWGALRARRTPR